MKPIAWTTAAWDAEDWLFVSGPDDPNGKLPGNWSPLYAQPQSMPKIENLLRCRDALVIRDCDEAYHQLYWSVDWENPLRPWAEWEKLNED